MDRSGLWKTETFCRRRRCRRLLHLVLRASLCNIVVQYAVTNICLRIQSVLYIILYTLECARIIYYSITI